MLTRLEVDGFKSLENLSLDLSPFTAIVGSNAAGKSNVFDAIQLLSSLATRDVSEAVKELRGEPLELFRRTGDGQSKRISLAAEVLVDPKVRDPWGTEVALTHTRMRYEVVLERREVRPGVERIQVAHEQVSPIRPKADAWATAMKPTKAFKLACLKYARQKDWLTTDPTGANFEIHQDGKQGRNRPATAAEATVLYSITNAEFPHLFALREELRQWRLLQLDPALLRRPTPVTASDVMTPDGANLAAVLARIKAETATGQRPAGVLSDIAAELNQLIPGVLRLDAGLHEASREYQLQLTMRDGLPFSSRVISDGTLRVLALLTLMHDPLHRGLVCFEEPENGVHPGRVKPLVERLREMVTRPDEFEAGDEVEPLSQLIINSHSPVVLSALVDADRRARHGAVLFADTASVIDPESKTTRRHTRLRRVHARPQAPLFELEASATRQGGFVSDYEVEQMLRTAQAEG